MHLEVEVLTEVSVSNNHQNGSMMPVAVGSGGILQQRQQRRALPKFPKNDELVTNNKHIKLLEALLPALQKHKCLELSAWYKPRRSPWVKAWCDLNHPAGPWGPFSNTPDLTSNKKYKFKSYQIPYIYNKLQNMNIDDSNASASHSQRVRRDLYKALDNYFSDEQYYKDFMAGCAEIACLEVNKPKERRAKLPEDLKAAAAFLANRKKSKNKNNAAPDDAAAVAAMAAMAAPPEAAAAAGAAPPIAYGPAVASGSRAATPSPPPVAAPATPEVTIPQAPAPASTIKMRDAEIVEGDSKPTARPLTPFTLENEIQGNDNANGSTGDAPATVPVSVTPGPAEKDSTTSSDNSVAPVSTPPGRKRQHCDSSSENVSEEQSYQQPTSRRRLMEGNQEDTVAAVATNENGGANVATAATDASSTPTTNNGDDTIDDRDLENVQTGNKDNIDEALPSTNDNAHSSLKAEDEEMDQENGTASPNDASERGKNNDVGGTLETSSTIKPEKQATEEEDDTGTQNRAHQYIVASPHRAGRDPPATSFSGPPDAAETSNNATSLLHLDQQTVSTTTATTNSNTQEEESGSHGNKTDGVELNPTIKGPDDWNTAAVDNSIKGEDAPMPEAMTTTAATTTAIDSEVEKKKLEEKVKYLQNKVTFLKSTSGDSKQDLKRYEAAKKKLCKMSEKLEKLLGIDTDLTDSDDSDDETGNK